MKLRVANGSIVVGRAVFSAATIDVADGRVAAIDPAISGSADIDLDGGWLVPGFHRYAGQWRRRGAVQRRYRRVEGLRRSARRIAASAPPLSCRR
jgi:cytosine/adenosine deaminase-related metal-dependent hydrolase